jgi:murein L,D-transpeptidase YcbB/YkuD
MYFRLICFLFLIAPGVAFADGEPDLRKALADTAALPDLSSPQRTELDGFYAQRGYKPAWNLTDETANKKTEDFLASVDSIIAYHGLTKSHYALANMRKLLSSKTEDDQQKLELMITESLLHLAHDLHGDSVNLDDLYPGWNFHRAPLDLPGQLTAALNEGRLEALFDRLSPQGDAYKDLARTLQDYRALENKGPWPTVALGESLKPGMHGPRVQQMRARLAAEGYESPLTSEGPDFFDQDLSKLLIVYQMRTGLDPDGHAGAATQAALNTSLAQRIDQIRANMERWRHMPEDFPPDRSAVVNIPNFSIAITEPGLIYRGIVVDGKPDRPTPFINSKIVNMVVNPPWNVPASIARKDILPKLRKDRHYLEKMGMVIDGHPSDPTGADIDWKKVSDKSFPYHLRQSPGDLNSLGQLKFNFVNPFDVYMHGTPHQELFSKFERAFSSGCVRLENPERVGEILLEFNKDKGGWTQQRINDEIDAGKTHWVVLAKPMPVYFLYWTVFTADDGATNFRKDIYGYDQELIDKMNEPFAKQ